MRIDSSSPSPSPVRLSPVCSTDPSGLRRLLKKTKCESDSTRPFDPSNRALASRSKSAPVVDRASQPSPTVMDVRFGALLESETFPPLVRATPMSTSAVRPGGFRDPRVPILAHSAARRARIEAYVRAPQRQQRPAAACAVGRMTKPARRYSAEHGAETKDSSGARDAVPG